jgi:transglutaminase-like putative cysteine protease
MKKCLITAVIIILTTGCTRNHLITDRSYRKTVGTDFQARKTFAANRSKSLFGVFDSDLNIFQKEALQFLFAYMPLSDLADYSGDFFLANINAALRARSETPWGMKIPEEIFLHYVLPFRVNNENLDSFRIAFYDEIMDRIHGLDLENAALEINHWCHEKVAYQPADIRTSSPMCTILSARGRCGEESTFTVASLRTAGIPARQVYTPRWAHTDDNHAWVEVWIDGKWYYMGACEPEPVLDRGWFTEPARRAMLVHTKSFGAWYGDQNIINKYKFYTEVNNLSKYAPVKRLIVKVTDDEDNPVSNSLVEYKLYNYAEFYTLAAVPTDDNGISSFETGFGDLLVWASKDSGFGYRLVTGSETDTINLKLVDRLIDAGDELYDLKVPVIQPPYPGLPADITEQNRLRFEKENIIRQSYIDSWIKPSGVREFALSLNADTTVIKDIISRSMGNYLNIMNFLRTAGGEKRDLAIAMLNVLNDKDLRDTKAGVLTDHLNNVRNPYDLDENGKLFIDYVLNPRVANEMIVAYRRYFSDSLPESVVKNATGDPSVIADYLDNVIRISDDDNYYRTPITPVGVNELKVSDADSRKICFVAICRSLGIPSRLEPGTNLTQYFYNSVWNDVYFHDERVPDDQKGYLKLISPDKNPVPEYYTNFTIAQFREGRYFTLEFDYGRKISDFDGELSLPAGNYMIVTGNRLPDGNILSGISFFRLKPGEHLTREINLRKETSEQGASGIINIDKLAGLLNTSSGTLTNDAGLLIAAVDPDREPSDHFLKDLCRISSELEKWEGRLVIIVPENKKFAPDTYKDFPSNTLVFNCNATEIFSKIFTSGSAPEMITPVVVLSEMDGSVRFASSGYRIGTGELILKSIKNN